MSLEEFFEELRTSGLKFEVNVYGRIRCKTAMKINEADYNLCPICALATAKGYGPYTNPLFRSAGTALGLSIADKEAIARAADRHEADYRAKLLEVLCL